MKTHIVYDSVYGNTELIAQAIAKELKRQGTVTVGHIQNIRVSDLKSLKLLIVGSPTHGGRPTPAMQNFLQSLPPDSLKNTNIASFDTRISAKDQGIIMRLFLKVLGYAAERLTGSLIQKGGTPVITPAGFIVRGKTGPLAETEIDRAVRWAQKITDTPLK